MSKMKLILTVFVGVLALSALTSSVASAQWMVNNTTLTGSETRALATTAAVDESGTLKAAGVTITCSGTTLNGMSPKIEASGEKGSASSLEFTTCSANENCKVTKSISTVPIHAVVELIAGNSNAVLILFLPKTKNVFSTINFEGEKCALLGVQPVKGKATAEGPTGRNENTLQQLAANISEASNELQVGSSAAELKGKALLKLASGQTWSFL